MKIPLKDKTDKSQNEAVLCYVEEGIAYFTTQPLAEQWGDDWNDAPFQHNAGTPYRYNHHDERQGIAKWDVIEVKFHVADLMINHVCDLSVEQLNKKESHWLQTHDGKTKIFAGTPISEFKAILARVSKGSLIAVFDLTGKKGKTARQIIDAFGGIGFNNTDDDHIVIANTSTNEMLTLYPGEAIARIDGKIIVGKAITAPDQPDITVSEGGQD